MFVVGDMMFDRTVKDRTDASKQPAYPFEMVRGSEGRLFRGQDLVVGNLEGPVTDVRRPPVKSIDFAFRTSIPSILRAEGFDVVSQANNHSLDQGRAGADESRELLRRAGLTVFGDQVYDDATSSLAVVERRGSRMAFVGFNTTDHPLDEAAALEAIEMARSGADHVVVFMHWGEEYRATPSRSQVDRAHWFIDHGVDAVIGAHPHWMQSVERYRGKLIAYSLGNFIFDQDWSSETNLGLTVGLRFRANGPCEMHLFPIGIRASQPRILTGEEREKRLRHLAEISDPQLTSSIESGVLTCDP
jgi:poly-gamma-glutamate synthesis protein (capsule biosynthesis protein)